MIGWSKPGTKGSERARDPSQGDAARVSEDPNKYQWKSSHPLADNRGRNETR